MRYLTRQLGDVARLARWGSFLACGLFACADYYELGLQGPRPPMAVGATATYQLQYTIAWDCKPDRFTRCGVGNVNAITQTTAVRVDDPSLLQATLQSDGKIFVRALAAGTTKVSADGIDASGKPQSASRTFYLMTPDEAQLDTNDSCYLAPETSPRTVAAGQVLRFEATVRSGTTTLHAEGLPIPLDRGALLPAPSGNPLEVLAPTTPALTTVKTLYAKPHSLAVRVYAGSGIDGVTLTPKDAGPFRVPNMYTLRLDLLAGGERVCQIPDPPAPRTVTILTPELCLLRPVPDVTMDPLLSQQDGSYLSVVYVQTLKAGECQLQVAVPSLALSSVYKLAIEAAQ